MVLFGQVRSGKLIGGNWRYLVAGLFNTVDDSFAVDMVDDEALWQNNLTTQLGCQVATYTKPDIP
jgi:hypothetical protein